MDVDSNLCINERTLSVRIWQKLFFFDDAGQGGKRKGYVFQIRYKVISLMDYIS